MRKYLGVFLLSGLVFTAFGQKSFFGAEAGINVANQRVLSITTMSTETSGVISFQSNALKPTFSVFYSQMISAPFSIRIHARYSALGYKKVGSQGTDVAINYLTIPLIGSYEIYKNLSLSAGPYVSFTLNNTTLLGQDITKTYHKNDFGFVVGVEHTLYKNFALNASYCVGLKNIWLADTIKDPFTNLTYQTKVTNRALQLTLIYKFKKPTAQ